MRSSTASAPPPPPPRARRPRHQLRGPPPPGKVCARTALRQWRRPSQRLYRPGRVLCDQSGDRGDRRRADAEGTTPPKSLDLLHELLDENCNEGNEYDDSHYVAASSAPSGRRAPPPPPHRGPPLRSAAVTSTAFAARTPACLTRSALPGSVTLELGGLAAPSWALYEEHAARGAGAAERLRLRLPLRLVLLLPESVQRPAGASRPLVALRHSTSAAPLPSSS